jgi:RNA polymerase sigma factor (sigma-70 family)
MAAAARPLPTSPAVAPLRLLRDRQLLERARAGSEAAFAAIFARHHQGLYRYALSILGTPDDARDAVQNTMVSLLGALPGPERELELKPWLFRIAHNESISIVRRRRERPLEEAPEPGSETDHHTRMQTRRLLGDLAELPDQQRTALVLRELNGLSHAEIAATLGVSEAAAKQTVYAARKALQESEQGREMTCEQSQHQLSDGDRRRLRGRALRAHLAECAGCRSFEAAIRSRRSQLAGLAPLPAALSAEILRGLLGSGVGPGGGAAALSGGGVLALSAGSSKITSLTVAVSAVGLAVGIGERAVDRDRSPAPHEAQKTPGQPGQSGPAGLRAVSSTAPSGARTAGGPGSGPRSGGSREAFARRPGSGGDGKRIAGGSDDRGSRAPAGSIPGTSGSGDSAGGSGAPTAPAPATPSARPAQPSAPPSGGGAPPGLSGAAPGLSEATPGQSGAAPPGLAGTPPGLAGATPGGAVAAGGGPPPWAGGPGGQSSKSR